MSKVGSPQVADYKQHSFHYDPARQRYIASLRFEDGFSLVIVVEAKDTIISHPDKAYFKRAILFGPQSDLEAMVDKNDNKFGFWSRGTINQYDVATYLYPGKQALYIMGDEVKQSEIPNFDQNHSEICRVIYLKWPPQEIVTRLVKREMKVLTELPPMVMK